MDYSQLADAAAIEKTSEGLKARGVEVILAKDRNEAKEKVLALVGSELSVMTENSRTLEETGIAEAINDSGKFQSVRAQLSKLDSKTQKKEMKQLANEADIAIGSVHAVTQEGQVLVASNTGSQLPAYAYGAGKVIWVVGAQKIVPDFNAAMDRIKTYVLPLESERVQKAYGMPHSNINKMLIFNGEVVPNRMVMVIVSEKLGF